MVLQISVKAILLRLFHLRTLRLPRHPFAASANTGPRFSTMIVVAGALADAVRPPVRSWWNRFSMLPPMPF